MGGRACGISVPCICGENSIDKKKNKSKKEPPHKEPKLEQKNVCHTTNTTQRDTRRSTEEWTRGVLNTWGRMHVPIEDAFGTLTPDEWRFEKKRGGSAG